MKKSWVLFSLVLIISSELVAFSFFHEVEASGIATGNSVIAIAKWNYVSAAIRITFEPLTINNSSEPVTLMFQNGTTVTITSTTYSITLHLPRTGDTLANGDISGPLPLSQQQPLALSLTQNVQDLQGYLFSLRSEESKGTMGGLEAQVYVITINGSAQVDVSGYGAAY